VALWRPYDVIEKPLDDEPRAAGVVHVHTTLSDGGGTPEEVVAAAQRAGLDFLALTDHNLVAPKALEGYHDRLLVLVGTEVSTTAGHVLGLGVRAPGYRFSGDVEDAFDDIRDLGGVAFVAHPTSPVPAFAWTAWDAPGPWGMELLNGDSQWREAGVLRLLRTALLYGLNPRYALLSSLSPPSAALARWDGLLARRDVAGIVGADAHSRVVLRRSTAVRFPSYDALFALARNHVLLREARSGDAQRDGAAIVDALAHGRSYMGLDALAPADGFSFLAEADGRRFTMGDTVPSATRLTFHAGGRMPRGARLRLLRDGVAVAAAEGTLVATPSGPGAYRVEARLPGYEVPWILSNPIYLYDSATAAARARAAAWPAPSPAPSPAVLLDGFEGPTSFAAEFDPSSSMRREVLDGHAGPDGSTAARMEFRLGVPSAAQPYTWCALVSRQARDLTGRTGLVFSVRGDGVHRLWVQVRDANPASADEGTEWWFASVRTSREWRRVAFPFARLRSLNKNSDGRLDLDRVRGIAFVIDAGAMPPGSSGSVWIDEVGVY
jgi:hypothetical protein